MITHFSYLPYLPTTPVSFKIYSESGNSSPFSAEPPGPKPLSSLAWIAVNVFRLVSLFLPSPSCIYFQHSSQGGPGKSQERPTPLLKLRGHVASCSPADPLGSSHAAFLFAWKVLGMSRLRAFALPVPWDLSASPRHLQVSLLPCSGLGSRPPSPGSLPCPPGLKAALLSSLTLPHSFLAFIFLL